MGTASTSAQGATESATLTIGELSTRTGVAVATLRIWEERHAFPRPARLPSGHRRYREDDVAAVRSVQAHRAEGLRLDVAIERATDAHLVSARSHAPSLYAGLRRGQPGLDIYRLRKSTLLGLSWAIEDEFCAKAERAHLFGAFQNGARYAAARPRWCELAQVAASAHVFAAFDDADADARPAEVHLDATSPMCREWGVVCDSVELPAALTAWELPGQKGVRDSDRLFEAMWTVDPLAVREAALLCAGLAADAGAAGATQVLDELRRPLVAGSTSLATVTSFLNRVVSYVDATGVR